MNARHQHIIPPRREQESVRLRNEVEPVEGDFRFIPVLSKSIAFAVYRLARPSRASSCC